MEHWRLQVDGQAGRRRFQQDHTKPKTTMAQQEWQRHPGIKEKGDTEVATTSSLRFDYTAEQYSIVCFCYHDHN